MEKDPRPRWTTEYSRLRGDIVNALLSRHVFERIAASVEANPGLDHTDPTFTFLDRWYVTSAALVVRRQCRDKDDSHSVLRLLNQIALRPDVLNVDANFVRDLVSLLEASSASVLAYVDRDVAHLDKRGLPMRPSFAELSRALDALERVFEHTERWLLDRERFSPALVLAPWWSNALSVPWAAPDAV